MYTMTTRKNNYNLPPYLLMVICIVILSMMINMQYVYGNLSIIGNFNIDFNQYIHPKTASVDVTDKNIELPKLEARYVMTAEEIAQEMIKAKEAELLEQQMLEEQRLLEMQTVESSRNVQYYEISVYTDLSVMKTITADEMNQIIEYWNSRNGRDIPFLGEGQIFIDAAKESGLDPVYILAHAAIESAWGTSYYATAHHNYFGIGAFDSNPHNAINYGNADLANGIIGGAMWIADNYYDNGQTSLYTMRYNNGSHEYCTSTTWMYNIANIMSTSYSLIA